jgi:protease IV
MDNAPEKRRSTAAFWILIILLAIALGFSIFMNIGMGVALLVTAPSASYSEDRPNDEFPVFEEEWSYGTGDVKVVRMELTGVITRESEGGLFQSPYDKVEDLIRAIRAARHDEEVKAIILEIDSPGGGITPSDEIYHELMQFKQSAEDRKIVIFMRDLAASGGYYVSMAGDWLIAEPTAIVGSIGVIMQSLNWKPLSDKIGITDTTIKSGENKDMLNPFRESDPKEIALLQEMIDQMHRRFRTIVSKGRGIAEADLENITDGRIFTSDQAMDLKLIDQVGYWSDAVAKTAELLGEANVKVVRYYQTQSFWDYLAGIKSPLQNPIKSLQPSTSFQYLWRP